MILGCNNTTSVLCLFFACQSAAASASALPLVPFSTKHLQNFIHNKCQNPLTNNAAIWSYEGHLVDPTNGNVIANVEGIELVRSLTEITRPDLSEKKNLWKLVRGLRRLDDLKVRSILAGPGWKYSGTVLSRKLFCYSPVGGGGLMKEYRLHPTAPVRKVNTDQAIALYDTATTFISTKNGKEMVIMTEFPDGHWIQSEAASTGFQGTEGEGKGDTTDGRKPFEFTVYARRSGKKESPALPSIAKAQQRKNRHKKSSMKEGPPRSKFIQFGKDDNTEDQRFGARETYSYIMGNRDTRKGQKLRSVLRETISNIKESSGLWDFETGNEKSIDPSHSCTVRYTRYGEAPTWYGPGKMCTLELWGKRVESVADAPPLAATLAATRIPGFLSVHTSIPSGPEDLDNVKKPIQEKQVKAQIAADDAAIRAVNWFRGKEESLPLEVLKENDNDENFVDSVVTLGLSVAQRVRAATTAKSAAEIRS
eukprot:scaffold654_cov253-Chaetoceros_neogracile.AAC.12